MKKRTILIITVLIIAIVLLIVNCISLSPFIFTNNRIIDPDDNYEIKKVVLGSVKDYCSSRSVKDQEVIYDVSSKDKIIHFDKEAERAKCLFCFVDRDFMETLEPIGKDEYRIVVTNF